MPEIEHYSSQINAITASKKASETSGSSSSSPSSLTSKNSLFGKYDLGMLLGRGAFAKVYQGHDVRTGQCVAIKVIDKKKLAIPALAENIKREITIMRHLRSHPNIIGLHEVLATRTKVYFVMDLVEGGELYARVSRGRLSEDASREYFRQLIFAIDYCHSRGVYHRDLKPENLLICDNGDLKVGDFGLSAVKEQCHTNGLLHTQCGTPAYVAPEILSQKGYDGAKVDVWACGIVLYVLTAGCLPFNDANLFNMFKKIRKGEFRYEKWMSSNLRGLLSRMLDPNPETRITIDEITRDPWFTLDSEQSFENEYEDLDEEEEDEEFDFLDDKNSPTNQDQTLNAFDLISFSPVLDLSGLFHESREKVEANERFVSDASAEEIIERIEGVARAEKLRVTKKGKKKEQKKEVMVELERQNGCLVAKVDISRLTDQLVVVEVARKFGEEHSYDEMWMKKLRPKLGDLVYQNDIDVPDEITPPSSPPPPSNDDDDENGDEEI